MLTQDQRNASKEARKPGEGSKNESHISFFLVLASWLPGFLASWLPGFLASLEVLLWNTAQHIAPYGRDRGGTSVTHWEPNEKAIYTPLPSPSELVAWRTRQAEQREELEQRKTELAALTEGAAAGERKQKLEEEIRGLENALERLPFTRALSVRERGPTPGPSHVLLRGDPLEKGEEVTPAVPAVLDRTVLDAALRPTSRVAANAFRRALDECGVEPSSGRRRALAEWITSPRHPLTARVFVNRVWQHLMGAGIVRTPNNFGRVGEAPTHPLLLDWLASEFVRGDWRVKPLIRTILLSRTYRRSSQTSNARALGVDPENRLLWRHGLRRLDAEALRDSVLAVSGDLNFAMGGRGVFPDLSADVLATQSRPGSDWGKSSAAERRRRSVYLFVKRTLMVPMLELFDYTNTAEALGRRPVTTVAPQALLLLNNKFIEQQATAFAERVRQEVGAEWQDQVDRAFRVALGRRPDAGELAVAEGLLRRGGLESICRVILNLNEFVYVD